jgi:hypothetical protein
VERLARWWNGSWGATTKKEVWLYRLDDGRYLVRWHGGDWRAPNLRNPSKEFEATIGKDWREGRHVYTDPADVIAALKNLLGEDQAGFQEITIE